MSSLVAFYKLQTVGIIFAKCKRRIYIQLHKVNTEICSGGVRRFRRLVELWIQPAQVSVVPVIDFLPIFLREEADDRSRRRY